MHTIVLVAVLVLAELNQAELAWVACLVAVAMHLPRSLAAPTRRVLIWLLALVAVGLVGAVNHAPRDAVRDLWVFSKLPLELAFGLLVAKALGYGRAVNVIAAVGALVSLEFVGRILLRFPEYMGNEHLVNRATFGGGSCLSLLALGLILDRGHRELLLPGSRMRRLWISLAGAVCTLAVLLSVSRTLAVVGIAFVVLKLAEGWRSSPQRVAALLVMGVVGAGTYSIVTATAGPFSGAFSGTVQELTLGDYSEPEDVNARWRGYESYLALREFRQLGFARKIVGGGFGQRVTLDSTMTLGGADFDAIPVLHNGYLYVLVKTGIVGIGLFCGFLVLLWRTLTLASAERDPRPSVFASWLVSFLVLTTVVAGGPFNKSAMTSVMILCGVVIGTLSVRSRSDERAHASRLAGTPIAHSGQS